LPGGSPTLNARAGWIDDGMAKARGQNSRRRLDWPSRAIDSGALAELD
jgi:hypothetical protein